MAFIHQPTICHCGGISKDCWEWRLPVSRRGHFFQDSFFEKTRTHFDAAVRDVLGRWGETDILSDTWHGTASSLINNLNRYRQLRSNRTQDEIQATTVVSDTSTHKIVMDVQDFMDEEDIKVKVLGEKEVLVEGHGKTNVGDGSLSSQMFSYRFTFPCSVNMSAITSVMSSDGVLTIEAPKLTNKENTALPERIEKTSKNATDNCTIYSTASKDVSKTGITADSVGHQKTNDKVFYCKECNKKIGSWEKATQSTLAHQEGLKVPIKIDASLIKNNQNVSQVTETHSTSKNDLQSKEIKIERNEDSLKAKEMDKQQATTKLESSDQSKILPTTKQESSDQSKILPTTTNESQTLSSIEKNLHVIPISKCFSSLPILRRGLFFSDSIFEDIRNDFQSAVQDVLSKWGVESSLMDNLTCYRNLRTRDLREENRAVKSVEDDSCHKFMLDVQDFMDGGEVSVKAINDRELVIDGRVENQEGSSKSLKRFLKRFVLPGDIKLDSVTSVMSSDGVLTITAPKKPPSIQLREVIIPVSKEETREKETDSNNKQNNHQDSHVSSLHSSDINESLTIKNSKEHLIPINVEKMSDMKIKAVNQVEAQNESNERSQNIQHQKEKSQESMKSQVNNMKEHIIPINVEGTCCDDNYHQKDKSQESMKSHASNMKEHIIPINVEKTSDMKIKVVNQVEAQTESNERSLQNIQHQKEKSQESMTSQSSNMKEHVIPINVEGECCNNKIKSVNPQLETLNESKERSFENIEHQKEKSQESTTKENIHSRIIENKTDSALKQTDNDQFSQQEIQSVSNKEKNLTINANDKSLSSTSTSRYLPITRRGVFFSDSFFEDYQKNFQNAVRDVLVKSRECVDVTDNMTTYRGLRQRDLKVENQALHAHEDQDSLKVVLDAKDFTNGDITVSLDGEELVIEGRAENNEANSSNFLTFSHRFLLPEFADLSSITSAISSDGILTVNSPKKRNSNTGAIRKMSSEARSKHESHSDGTHRLEEKNVKESSQQSKGFSSHSFSSNYNSQQHQSSMF